jgi:septal ring-binding cell division protein DamX
MSAKSVISGAKYPAYEEAARFARAAGAVPFGVSTPKSKTTNHFNLAVFAFASRDNARAFARNWALLSGAWVQVKPSKGLWVVSIPVVVGGGA